jgi:hypothetical protein
VEHRTDRRDHPELCRRGIYQLAAHMYSGEH